MLPFEDVREDVRRYTESMVQEVIGELANELPSMPPGTVRVVLAPGRVPGSAKAALLQAAEEADLLVVGSRGHGEVGSLLLGSVSLACTMHAPCPITVVHATRPRKVEEPAVPHAAPASPDPLRSGPGGRARRDGVRVRCCAGVRGRRPHPNRARDAALVLAQASATWTKVPPDPGPVGQAAGPSTLPKIHRRT